MRATRFPIDRALPRSRPMILILLCVTFFALSNAVAAIEPGGSFVDPKMAGRNTS
jgi:hypothetical protein